MAASEDETRRLSNTNTKSTDKTNCGNIDASTASASSAGPRTTDLPPQLSQLQGSAIDSVNNFFEEARARSASSSARAQPRPRSGTQNPDNREPLDATWDPDSPNSEHDAGSLRDRSRSQSPDSISRAASPGFQTPENPLTHYGRVRDGYPNRPPQVATRGGLPSGPPPSYLSQAARIVRLVTAPRATRSTIDYPWMMRLSHPLGEDRRTGEMETERVPSENSPPGLVGGRRTALEGYLGDEEEGEDSPPEADEPRTPK